MATRAALDFTKGSAEITRTMQDALNPHRIGHDIEQDVALEGHGSQRHPDLRPSNTGKGRLAELHTTLPQRRDETASGGRIVSMNIVANLLQIPDGGRRENDADF